MKIIFEDNSFLELEYLQDGSVRFVLCGIKAYNKVTMSTANIKKDQVGEIIEFLSKISLDG